MARVNFRSIFTVHPNGSLEPQRVIRINGITVRPGVQFRDTTFNGVNLFDPQFFDHDLEVKLVEDIIVITGIY